VHEANRDDVLIRHALIAFRDAELEHIGTVDVKHHTINRRRPINDGRSIFVFIRRDE